MSIADDFFQEPREQSLVKTRIVRGYFGAWAGIMLSVQDRNPRSTDKKLGYIDLFAGQGFYEDGSPSTPVVLLEMVLKDRRLRERLVTLFNDKEPQCAMKLRKAVFGIPGIESLRYKPIVTCSEIDKGIADLLQEKKLVPSLVFLDPCGYKGLSLDLMSALLKDWGCDCIVFFNYNRIRAAINNENVEDDMVALFGSDAVSRLKMTLPSLSPSQCETQVIEEFSRSLMSSAQAEYVLPFRFVDEKRRRTSHHIVFATKHFLGYNKMKHIMAKESSMQQQDVASFEYNKVAKHLAHRQPVLFEYSRPLEELAEMLFTRFEGKTISFNDLYRQHSVGRWFIERNYRTVLLKLESDDRISIEEHRKGSLPGDRMITFPRLSNA